MRDEEIVEYLKNFRSIGIKSRCHYVENIKTNEKTLISLCESTVYSEDIEDCSCKEIIQKTKKELLEEIKFLNKRVKELENYNAKKK